MKILLASDVDPMVQNPEIENPLLGFDLFPGKRHQHRIETHPRHLGQYRVSLRRGACRRVAELASTDEKGLAVNHELWNAVLRMEVRQIGRLNSAQTREDQTERNGTVIVRHLK